MADTIFALSSGRPPAAISVIRVSGPRAHEAGARIAGSLPEARNAAVRELRHPVSGELLDEGLVLRFDSPASSTGEDVVEFQCHGGRAVIDAVLSALGSLEGLRAAEPGEFTRRAFGNGRIDLTEAEGLADLIEAETGSQRKAALAIAEGGLRKQIENPFHGPCRSPVRGRARSDIEIFENGQVREDAPVFRHQADAGTSDPVSREARDIGCFPPDPPGSRRC